MSEETKGTEDVRSNRKFLLIAAAMLTVGLIAGGYLLGDGLKRAHLADRAVTMRGLAERDVTADLATWTINFNAQGTELDAVRADSDQRAQTVLAFLRQAGFPAEAVTDGGGSVNQFYDTNRGANQVTVSRRIQLRTNDVMRARAAYARQFELIRGGVALQEGSGIQYSFTQLNSVKPAMIAQATQNARQAAEQFARDSNTGVGGIRSATQGYFSIGARDGDVSEEGGGGGNDSPFQKVRVVTTIEFYLS